MSNRTYKNLLNLNEASFRKIVSGLIKSIKNAEIELQKTCNLIDAIFLAIGYRYWGSFRRDEGESWEYSLYGFFKSPFYLHSTRAFPNQGWGY